MGAYPLHHELGLKLCAFMDEYQRRPQKVKLGADVYMLLMAEAGKWIGESDIKSSDSWKFFGEPLQVEITKMLGQVEIA